MIITDLLELGERPTQEQMDNAKILIPIVNVFEDFLNANFKCTSGIRTMQTHIEIYEGLRAKDIKEGKPPRPIPLKSQHLKGNAVDFVCPSINIKDLQHLFLSDELVLLAEKYGAWFEMFDYTPSWIHLQRVSPASGKRFFQPY